MANPNPRTTIQAETPVTAAPVAEDPMKAFEARMEARMREMEMLAEARVREAEEKAESVLKRALEIEEAAKVRVSAAEAAAKAQVAEAQRIVTAVTSPGAQTPVKVTARSKEDVEVLCLRTQLLGVRAGGRTYQFIKDEVISMDPSHAKEYEATGWVKCLKHIRR